VDSDESTLATASEKASTLHWQFSTAFCEATIKDIEVFSLQKYRFDTIAYALDADSVPRSVFDP
jgi:hypothetical protein